MAFHRISKHFWWRKHRTKSGELSVHYYARIKCRLKKKARTIPLGTDLKTAKDQLTKIEAKNIDRYDFDLDKRVQAPARDGKASPFTFTEWAARYPTLDEVKAKRSLSADVAMLRLHLVGFFGKLTLVEITRESLRRYIDQRSTEPLIRDKNGGSSKLTGRGSISNELSLLRHMLRLANREGFAVVVPSFDGLIQRTARGGRALSSDEVKKVLGALDPWMKRLAEFALETSLSQGDLLRLTEAMIDEDSGTVVPAGGRKKTEVEQVSPLTDRCRQILAEIHAERKAGRIVANVSGLIFTRDDGSRISRDMIHNQVRTAIKATGIQKFVFHNFRNTALTEWARRGIPVEVAMKASGHASVQMHNRYVDLQRGDVGKAFGTAADWQKCDPGVTQEEVGRRGRQ